MPIVMFAIVLAVLVVLYYFFVINQKNDAVDKPKANDPFNVIYLPDDLEAEKARRKRNDIKNDNKNNNKDNNKEGPEDES